MYIEKPFAWIKSSTWTLKTLHSRFDRIRRLFAVRAIAETLGRLTKPLAGTG